MNQPASPPEIPPYITGGLAAGILAVLAFSTDESAFLSVIWYALLIGLLILLLSFLRGRSRAGAASGAKPAPPVDAEPFPPLRACLAPMIGVFLAAAGFLIAATAVFDNTTNQVVNGLYKSGNLRKWMEEAPDRTV